MQILQSNNTYVECVHCYAVSNSPVLNYGLAAREIAATSELPNSCSTYSQSSFTKADDQTIVMAKKPCTSQQNIGDIIIENHNLEEAKKDAELGTCNIEKTWKCPSPINKDTGKLNAEILHCLILLVDLNILFI